MPSQGQDPAFDPFRPFVAEDGLEYEDLASYLCSKPVDCARNDVIEALQRHGRVKADGPAAWGGWVAAQYYYQDRDGDSFAATPRARDRTAHLPQGWDRFAPGFPDHGRQAAPDPARDGGADPGPAPSAAVREACEPEVRRGMGA